MTPLRVAAYLRETFAGSSVAVRVVEDRAVLAREYPLLAAVDRAAASVPRHRGCVVHLEYVPPAYERTVMLVGKGVTYDTGGCDIKAGGVMAGMSRDKCGAAAVAGFLKADNAASSALPRGHQAPAAFLLLVSGLHEADVPYAHLDVAASAGDLPHPPTAAPLLGLAAYHGLLSKR
ncbi:hypothetical protein B5X24_HaOG209896 [Helicoverpa armigera]|uniref:Cytosol aminopeptidase domain-containing protein n=1 Tax=Helicoverpa armigera TaxID=29058 RepID=A0A2W1BK55_HELAM|nr:hypothetical protein B5X24_HaOG209896 [Helicoverpa armigera]